MTWPCLSSLQWIPWPQGHMHGRAARGSPPRYWLPFHFLGWSSCSIKGALWDGEGLSSVWWELLVFIKLSFLSLCLCDAVGNLQFFTLQKSVLSNTWNQMCVFFPTFSHAAFGTSYSLSWDNENVSEKDCQVWFLFFWLRFKSTWITWRRED